MDLDASMVGPSAGLAGQILNIAVLCKWYNFSECNTTLYQATSRPPPYLSYLDLYVLDTLQYSI